MKGGDHGGNHSTATAGKRQEGKGLTVTARYQEVGRGWSKKRPEF